MKINVKHTLFVAAFLGLLCASMAAVIAGVDLATKETIAQNRIEKEKKGLTNIFGDVDYGDATEIKDDDYPYLNKYWIVENVGRVYSASGKNAYGTVSLLIGVYPDYSLGNISVLENTESYGAALEEGYFEPYRDAQDKDAAVENVKCGATYGAKLCRDMMKQSQAHFKEGK